MLIRNQFIDHTMHKECWWCNFTNFINILKSVLNEIFQYTSSLIFSNCPNWFKAWHKQHTPRLPLTGNMCCRPSTHTSSKNDNICFINAQHLINIIIDIKCIIEYVFFVCFKNIAVIRLILRSINFTFIIIFPFIVSTIRNFNIIYEIEVMINVALLIHHHIISHFLNY